MELFIPVYRTDGVNPNPNPPQTRRFWEIILTRLVIPSQSSPKSNAQRRDTGLPINQQSPATREGERVGEVAAAPPRPFFIWVRGESVIQAIICAFADPLPPGIFPPLSLFRYMHCSNFSL